MSYLLSQMLRQMPYPAGVSMRDHGEPDRERLLRNEAVIHDRDQDTRECVEHDKLERAVRYLQERKLWRGSADCEHVYTDSTGVTHR